MTEASALAEVIHAEVCSRITDGKCRTWDTDTEYGRSHRTYYEDRAASISRQLEPLIGAESLPRVCQVILEEME